MRPPNVSGRSMACSASSSVNRRRTARRCWLSRRRRTATSGRTWRRQSPTRTGACSSCDPSRSLLKTSSSAWWPLPKALLRQSPMKSLVVCRRELRSYFGSYIAYVLLAVFLLLSGYFFYTNLIFFVLFGGYMLPTGLWQFVFLDMRLCLMLILPLLTMRLFAEERKLGTIELL